MIARNMVATLVAAAMLLNGKVRTVRRKAEEGEIILSVYFHSPSKKLFTGCVKWFLKNGFTFITASDLEQIASREKPFPKSAVLFTVDDGWQSNKENIAAVANEYKIPVTIFASTAPIEKDGAYWWSYIAKAKEQGLITQSVGELKKLPNEERIKILSSIKEKLSLPREALTKKELQQIAQTPYVHIGSHTVTHPILSKCNDDTAAYELSTSKKQLEEWLGKPVDHFAYPNGNYTPREIRNLKKDGYKLAFTTQPGYITRSHLDNLYELPRFDVLEDVSFAENITRMTGAWFAKKVF